MNVQINRGWSPTAFQAYVERALDAAERAASERAIDGTVTDAALLALAELCWELALWWAPSSTTILQGDGEPTFGVPLSEHLVLVTRFSVRDVEWLEDSLRRGVTPNRIPMLIADGGAALTSLRPDQFRDALHGATGLLLRDAASLANGDEYDWGSGASEEAEVEVEVDGARNPRQMVERVRYLQRRTERAESGKGAVS